MVCGAINLAPSSRIETQGEPFEPVALDAVLADVLGALQLRIEERGAEITVASVPTVRGDRAQLYAGFQNLVQNAITYTGERPPHVHIIATRDGRDWIVAVEDDGIGIAPADQDRLFEVFERLRTREEQSGIGMGLALCQRLVERHGGELEIESDPSDDATFPFASRIRTGPLRAVIPQQVPAVDNTASLFRVSYEPHSTRRSQIPSSTDGAIRSSLLGRARVDVLANCSSRVTRATLLVPIRSPFHAASVQTLTHAISCAEQFDDAHLLILHVNLLHRGKTIDRPELEAALEEAVGLPSNASCHVRDAYLLETAILDEATQQNADYVIIGKSLQSRWRQLLADRLGIGLDLESILHHQLDADLVVV